MLNFNAFEEALNSIKQHKRRNILTGFGVAWGIFILVTILSAGEGFQEGIMRFFKGFAQNSVWLYGGQSSKVAIGKTEGKYILFHQTDIELLKKRFKEIEKISPEINYQGNSIVSYKDKFGNYSIKGVNQDYFSIKTINVKKGRLFDKFDNEEKRKVAIIGSKVKSVIFNDEKAIGKFINIAGTWFKVVGVLKTGTILNQSEQTVIYIPCNAMKETYNQGEEFTVIGLTLNQNTDPLKFQKKIKTFLSNRLGFDKSDRKALLIFNYKEQMKGFGQFFTGVKVFLWLVGLALLLSGIVSISNIMLVVVKERTKEIGIRKAVGAEPNSILFMVLSESIIITFISGIIGLISGFAFISVINVLINFFMDKSDFFIKSLNMNMPIAIGSLVLVIISGVIAGFVPAKRAADIKPISALNYNSD